MAGAGYKLFTTGEVLTAAQVNTYLQEQTVMSFADAAARTSALSAVLAEGMMSYLRDTNAVQVYNGSAWVAVGGSSPLTTKGDLYGFSTLDARVPIGTNNQVLTADSAQALGLKWATPTAAAFSGASVYRSSAQSIPSGTNTNVLWNAEYFDTNAYHDPTTNTDRLTVTTAGYYLFATSLTFGGNSNAGRQMELRRFNSSNVQQETRIFYYQWTTPASVENVQGSAVYSCSAGDYFVAVARQDTGSAVDIRPVTNGDTFASIVSLGA